VFLLLVGVIQILTSSDFGLVANYFGENLNETPKAFGAIPRISGTSNSSNVFGQWIVVFCSLLNAKLLFSEKKIGSRRIYIVPLLCLEVIVLMFSLSRGSMLFFLFTNVVVFFIWIVVSKRHYLMGIFFMAGILVVSGFLGYRYYKSVEPVIVLIERFESNADESRFEMLKKGLTLLNHPKVFFFGTGLGAFFPALMDYGIGTKEIKENKDLSTRAYGIHNVPALLLVEGGVFVFLTFSAFYVLALKKAFNVMAEFRHTPLCYLGVYLFSILLGLLVPMQVYASTANWNVLMFIILVIGVTNALGQRRILSTRSLGSRFSQTRSVKTDETNCLPVS
jgi:hypothetical protein